MTGKTENLISEIIKGAEYFPDALDGLIEKTATDPGAAFRPSVLERRAVLKKDDPGAFEVLRAKLKKCGCRVTVLDEAISEESGSTGGRSPKQANVLINLADSLELFHAPDKTGFADLDTNGHRETWPIRSKGFRRWLVRRFFEETQGAPNSEALQAALNVIEAKADFEASERVVHVRVGGHDGKLYLDLCNETWQSVEIDPHGWRVIDNPPVRFRRAAGMKPLPVPTPGGSVEDLRAFLNVGSHRDFVLVVAWALAVLRNRGPYPVMVLYGEQGSAKSTFAAILKNLLDPNTAALRALPREDRELFIAANNGHILAFDNVSGVPPWISDTLCRLSTGGSFAVRELYSNQDEVLFDAVRPIILNGIEEVITRPDLADRALILTLEPIPEERRRPEEELWAAFEIARPRILGALLDAVAQGLAMQSEIRLEKLPRLADFARWATAWEKSLWPAGTFMRAYDGNRGEAVENVIDADSVALAVRAMIAAQAEWTGTASDLLSKLGDEVGETQRKSKDWPSSPRALSGRLRRAATFLRKVGVEIQFRHAGKRTIQISTTSENSRTQSSIPSAASATGLEPNGGNGLVAYPTRTLANHVDGRADNGGEDFTSTVRANSLRSGEITAADGSDASTTPQSVQGKTNTPDWEARL